MNSYFLKPFVYFSFLLLLSCKADQPLTEADKQRITVEIREMLNQYYVDVNREGLIAEFKYLDNSPGFFWNAPGYNSTLSYDSMRTEVEKNAAGILSVHFRWDTLRIIPMTNDIATYTGIAQGEMTDTSGIKTEVSLLESGTAIRRTTGWKILNGHTTVLQDQQENQSTIRTGEENMKKVTGIGGIFFKSEDPQKMKEWYNKHLGLQTDQWGTNFEWRQADAGTQKGFTQWSPFTKTTTYFEPSGKDFMINYRVENLEALLEELRKEGVTVLDEIETHEYGKFVHILDVEGNKIELWEPDDKEYDKLVEGRTK